MSNHDREGSHPSNRDTPLERAWRDASAEQPPTHLDAAIIAAARKSVTDRSQPPVAVPVRGPSRNRFTQWQPLAAAATVAGLAFVLVQMLPREQGLAPPPQRRESAPAATVAQPPTQGSSAGETIEAHAAFDNSEVPRTDTMTGARERADIADRAPEQDAVAPPPPASAPAASTAEPAARDAAGRLGEGSAARAKVVAPGTADRAAPAAAAAAPAAPAMASESRRGNTAPIADAAAWANRIATLHAAGDLAAAEQALREFRAAEPDADSLLPESLRSWARTVE